MNPADHASRGITADDHEAVQHWINGPEFLWLRDETWQQTSDIPEVPENDPEIKKIITVHASRVDSTANYVLTLLEQRI